MTKKKIGRLHHAETRGHYTRSESSSDEIIDVVNELVDSHNESVDNGEKQQKKFLKQFDQPVCICYQLSRHSKEPEVFCSCNCHQPTTPEKKCDAHKRGDHADDFEDTEPCHCKCVHQGESEKSEEVKTTYTKIGMLRQWLNEDRITDNKKMVSNEDIYYWLSF